MKNTWLHVYIVTAVSRVLQNVRYSASCDLDKLQLGKQLAFARKWGNDYILVTGDGLQIEDSCGTQGRCTIGSYGSMQSLRAKLA